jgi:hypothetical protein
VGGARVGGVRGGAVAFRGGGVRGGAVAFRGGGFRAAGFRGAGFRAVGFRGGFGRGFNGGWGRGFARGFGRGFGRFGRGFNGGFFWPWYGGFGCPWYGGFGYPWYGGYDYPWYTYPNYSLAGGSDYYSPYYSGSYSPPYVPDSYGPGVVPDVMPYCDPVSAPTQPLILNAGREVITPYTSDPSGGTYLYDGGPADPVPLPAVAPRPRVQPPAARPDADTRYVAQPVKPKKYTYAAYGEKPQTPTAKDGRTVLTRNTK